MEETAVSVGEFDRQLGLADATHAGHRLRASFFNGPVKIWLRAKGSREPGGRGPGSGSSSRVGGGSGV
jgi:hypothetical protein